LKNRIQLMPSDSRVGMPTDKKRSITMKKATNTMVNVSRLLIVGDRFEWQNVGMMANIVW